MSKPDPLKYFKTSREIIRLAVMMYVRFLPGADEAIAPTHWSSGQLSSLVGAPAAYLRQLPAPLSGINLP